MPPVSSPSRLLYYKTCN